MEPQISAINRRTFIKSIPAASTLAAAALANSAEPVQITQNHYDIIVAGAGPAGITAATQAARCGVKTLLIEKNSIVGGTTVSAHVNFPGLFHAWGKQVIAGIGWELITKTVSHSDGQLPDFTADVGKAHYKHQVRIDKFVYSTLAEQMIVDAGCQLLLHSMPAAVEKRDNLWHVTICGKEGLQKVSATVLVDCTGDANLTAMAGLALTKPKDIQPGTVIFRLTGYDPKSLDFEKIQLAFENSEKNGLIKWSDIGGTRQHAVRSFLSKSFGQNSHHVDNIPADTSQNRTIAELKGRESLMRIYNFFRTQSGLKNLHYEFFSHECGIRQTVNIVGKKTITAKDYVSGRMWPDAICYSFYPIDLHQTGGKTIDIQPLVRGTFPTIPRDAMLPEKGCNIIAAGRCISGDRMAHSAFRVQASCMAMGQAAGAMAALAALEKTNVENIPIKSVRLLLRKHNAIVPPDEPAQV
jgi:hypothetical protein